MVNVTVRNVPDSARDRLAERARRQGKSLQEYLRLEMIGLSERPTVNEWLDQVRAEAHGSRTTVSAEDIVQMIREDRDSH